jgi:hypothetical protein
VYIGRRRLPRSILKGLDLFLRWAAVFLGASAKVTPANVWDFLQPPLQAVQAGFYIPAVLIVTPLIAWARTHTDNARLDDVHRLLDQLRDKTFRHDAAALAQHRRVTLFRHKWFALHPPFFGGFLVPIERSGTFTRRTRAYFRAPDDGERCEGIAGRTWGGQKIVYIERLPELRVDCPEVSVQQYAEKTFISPRRARRYIKTKKVAPKSILGFPIEVNNKPWGVLVFDSTGETIAKKAASTAFNTLSATLNGYLKGL